MIRFLGKLAGRILTGILACLLAANLYAIGIRHFTGTPQPAVFGWSWAVVISGSMEPAIRVNDLVVVHEQSRYEVGDIITYETGNSVVTHRIIEKDAAHYITQGDANNTHDLNPVPENRVVGKVVAVIPGLGRFIEYLRTPLGMTCLVLVGFLLIEIPYLLDKRREEEGGYSQ